jgi:CheY-like chemotaxis protein
MSKKILVVDDNVDSIMILRSILESQDSWSGPRRAGSTLDVLTGEVPDLVPRRDDAADERHRGARAIKTTHATSKVPVIMITVTSRTTTS